MVEGLASYCLKSGCGGEPALKTRGIAGQEEDEFHTSCALRWWELEVAEPAVYNKWVGTRDHFVLPVTLSG